jgi:hypothetical protein
MNKLPSNSSSKNIYINNFPYVAPHYVQESVQASTNKIATNIEWAL